MRIRLVAFIFEERVRYILKYLIIIIIVYFIKRHIYNGIKKNCHKVKPTNKLLGSLFGTNEILDKRAIRSLTKTSGTS